MNRRSDDSVGSSRWVTHKASIAALALVAVMAGAGVAHAAIPSSTDGVIHSCYSTNANASGNLRVIDAQGGATCAKSEKSLNFNQTGPPGSKGDTGPSDAYSSTSLGITLPPGYYTLMAVVHTYVPPNGYPTNQQCAFSTYGTGNTTQSTGGWVDLSPGQSIVTPVIGTATIVTEAFADVKLACDNEALVSDTMITATRVGALHDVS